jgi:mono/diheme cytochrome c family protein
VGACASCHDIGRQGPSSGSGLHLGLATVVHLDRPGNLIKIILEGIAPPQGEPGRWMPAYAGAFTDEQLAQLVQYIRAEYSRRPDWKDVEEEVRKAKKPR